MVLYIIIGLYIVLAVIGAYIMYASICKNKSVMSFKQAIDLCNMPIVTFYIGDIKLNFLLDTGAYDSCIDARYVEKFNIPVKYTDKLMHSYSASGTDMVNKTGYINIYYNNTEFCDRFTINPVIGASFDFLKKSKGIRVHGLLGSTFFNKYKYIIDFKKMEFRR